MLSVGTQLRCWTERCFVYSRHVSVDNFLSLKKCRPCMALCDLNSTRFQSNLTWKESWTVSKSRKCSTECSNSCCQVSSELPPFQGYLLPIWCQRWEDWSFEAWPLPRAQSRNHSWRSVAPPPEAWASPGVHMGFTWGSCRSKATAVHGTDSAMRRALSPFVSMERKM